MAPLEVCVADIFQCTCHTPFLVLGAPQPELCHVGKYMLERVLNYLLKWICVCVKERKLQ